MLRMMYLSEDIFETMGPVSPWGDVCSITGCNKYLCKITTSTVIAVLCTTHRLCRQQSLLKAIGQYVSSSLVQKV
jgi:hypothetical protein